MEYDSWDIPWPVYHSKAFHNYYVSVVRFKLLDMFIYFSTRDCYFILFTRAWHCVTLWSIQVSGSVFNQGFSIATCFRSLVFWSSFLLFYSSFFVYFFASPDHRNICKFTLCCDFQLVYQFLRNIVIYYIKVSGIASGNKLIKTIRYPHMWRYDIFTCEDIDDFGDIKFVS